MPKDLFFLIVNYFGLEHTVQTLLNDATFLVCLILIGFGILSIGGSVLLNSSLSFAKKYKVSGTIIGITIIAYSTTAPELFLGMNAVLKGDDIFVLTNAIGSAITVLLVGFIISGIIGKARLSAADYRLIIYAKFFCIIAAILFYSTNILKWKHGIILVISYLIFLLLNIEKSRIDKSTTLDILKKIANQSLQEAKKPRLKKIIKLLLNCLTFAISIALLLLGSEIVIVCTRRLINIFHLSEKMVVGTIIVICGALPEIVTILIAAIKKQSNIIIGTVIGSVVFNFVFMLGTTSFINSIEIDRNFKILDITFFLFCFMTVSMILIKRKTFGISLSIVSLILYTLYLSIII